MNDPDNAFEWFERAYEAGSCELMLTKVLPAIDPVRSDPRMARLLQDRLLNLFRSSQKKYLLRDPQ